MDVFLRELERKAIEGDVEATRRYVAALKRSCEKLAISDLVTLRKEITAELKPLAFHVHVRREDQSVHRQVRRELYCDGRTLGQQVFPSQEVAFYTKGKRITEDTVPAAGGSYLAVYSQVSRNNVRRAVRIR